MSIRKRYRVVQSHHSVLPIFGREIGELLNTAHKDFRFKWVAHVFAFMGKGSMTGLIEYRTHVEKLEP